MSADFNPHVAKLDCNLNTRFPRKMWVLLKAALESVSNAVHSSLEEPQITALVTPCSCVALVSMILVVPSPRNNLKGPGVLGKVFIQSLVKTPIRLARYQNLTQTI